MQAFLILFACSAAECAWGEYLCRYLDNMTSERVDSEGVTNVAKFAQQLPKAEASESVVLAMGSDEDLQARLSTCPPALQNAIDTSCSGKVAVSRLQVIHRNFSHKTRFVTRL